MLPNLLDLYHHIGAYIDRHRGVLLGDGKDPGTFFVKTVEETSTDAAYDQTTFYEASATASIILTLAAVPCPACFPIDHITRATCWPRIS